MVLFISIWQTDISTSSVILTDQNLLSIVIVYHANFEITTIFCKKNMRTKCILTLNIMIWKCFLYYCPFVRKKHKWLVDSTHKGPLMWRFDDSFDDILNKLLNKMRNCHWLRCHVMHVMSLWWHPANVCSTNTATMIKGDGSMAN